MQVFRQLREWARLHGQATLNGCQRKSLVRRMEHLLDAAQITNQLDGRRRQLSTADSTRVATYLLLPYKIR